MISSKDWSFAHAKAEGRKRGKYVDGLFGNHENRGSTQQAMEIILSHFKKVCVSKPPCENAYSGCIFLATQSGQKSSKK